MNRDWNDFKALHANIAGAREAFEAACESLFRKIYINKHVSQISVKHGDGGIDIFIGDLGIEPITVIQCKFFLETFGDTQKTQIRDSFKTAYNSDKFELKEWILCIPRVIDIDETSWWFNWKNKKITEYNKHSNFITIKNGNELIDLFKEYDLYNQIFRIEDSRKIAEIYNVIVPRKIAQPSSIIPKNILFNNYSEKNKLYYIERQIDKEFVNSLQLNNIWLYGKSGVGKTVLVNRNLIDENIEYCSCDLSPITIKSSDDVLNEILCVIEDKFDIKRNESEKNKIKQITQILCETGKKRIIIVIDELSVKDNLIIKSIANDLISLVTYFRNTSDKEELKFVISTIYNPKEVVDNTSKANEHFQYLCCNEWLTDIERLFDLLNSSLNLQIEQHKDKIIDSCSNSPRILKSIFRKILSINSFDTISIERAINDTIFEIVN